MSTQTVTLERQDISASIQRLKRAFTNGRVAGVEIHLRNETVYLKMGLNRLSDYHFAYNQNRCSWTTSKRKIVLPLADFTVEQSTANNIFSLKLKRRSSEPRPPAPNKASNPVREIFVQRSLRAIEELKRLDERKLAKAVEAPTDYSVLLSALNTDEALATIRSRDPLASARLRGLEAKRKLLESEGGTLSSSEAARLLRISRQAIDKRRGEGKLLAVQLGRKGYHYPAWQFGLTGMDAVLAALKDRDAWEQLSFFLNPSDLLSDRTPLKVLQESAKKLPRVIEAASAYGEHGG